MPAAAAPSPTMRAGAMRSHFACMAAQRVFSSTGRGLSARLPYSGPSFGVVLVLRALLRVVAVIALRRRTRPAHQGVTAGPFGYRGNARVAAMYGVSPLVGPRSAKGD